MSKRIQEIKTKETSELFEIKEFFQDYVQEALKKDNLVRRENIAKNQGDQIDSHLESTQKYKSEISKLIHVQKMSSLIKREGALSSKIDSLIQKQVPEIEDQDNSVYGIGELVCPN